MRKACSKVILILLIYIYINKDLRYFILTIIGTIYKYILLILKKSKSKMKIDILFNTMIQQ